MTRPWPAVSAGFKPVALPLEGIGWQWLAVAAISLVKAKPVDAGFMQIKGSQTAKQRFPVVFAWFKAGQPVCGKLRNAMQPFPEAQLVGRFPQMRRHRPFVRYGAHCRQTLQAAGYGVPNNRHG